MQKLLLISLAFSLLFSSTDIIPIPLEVSYDKKKALLGKKLFFDTRLSADNTISCSSCHTLPGSGANASSFSFGVNGAEGEFNSPTVLNSANNFVQFWDGRAKDLKEQALFPIINPNEMANTLSNLMKTLEQTEYKQSFSDTYDDGLTIDNVADAISEFQTALFTPNSRFDKFLRGDLEALNEDEKKGYEYFKSMGCISCHNGINIGSNMYQKMGHFLEYKQTKPSTGRYAVTKRERDKHVYKVPSLRNIAITAPYFHDGREYELKKAIFEMQEHQLGIEADKTSIIYLEKFLKTLTGESPKILEEDYE